MRGADLSLKWLEVFRLAATLGSVQAVAQETGLATSTVSHHLRSLESKLGVALLDHTRRPMVVTPAGSVFLKYAEEALRLIRKARSEAVSGNVHQARQLHLGLIEDLDSDIGPDLAVDLAAAMPSCDFTHYTRPSHEILELLRKRRIDIGIANRPVGGAGDLLETPLLRDPFVLALPLNAPGTPADYLAGTGGLPYLRYSSTQFISRQIDTQLRRLKTALPHRFEIESNQTMMAMIAAGSGWAVTTPLSYLQARRFHPQVRLHRLPGRGVARTVSVFAAPDCAETPRQFVVRTLQRLVQKRAVQPALEMMPWLGDSFRLYRDP